MNKEEINVAHPQVKLQALVPAIIVIKLQSTAKLDIEASLCKAAQITTKCCRNGIEVVDIISTFGNSKDVTKRVKALTEHKEIQLLLLYSAQEISETSKEFTTFVADMRDWHNLKVICYR